MPRPCCERLPLQWALQNRARAAHGRNHRGCGQQSKMLEGTTRMQNLRLRAWSSASSPRPWRGPLLGPAAVSLAVGIAYFVAARFGLVLLTAPDGVPVF